MSDALLYSSDQEEALSRVYVSAVAAIAGYTTCGMDFDRDGVDIQIRAGGSMRPSLDIQLKSTINIGDVVEGNFRYPLKKRNYDLLRETSMVPRILVVLDLPREPKEWLTVSPNELVLKRCAYWTSLAGQPENDNATSVTVSIPDRNRFNVESLTDLMDRARRGAVV